MKIAARLLLCVALIAAFARPTMAQTLLKQLEAQLKGVTAATGPTLSNPAPTAAGQATGGPGFLGMMADDRMENNRGVRVLDVMPGGPAQLSGLLPGDLITSVAGRPVHSMAEFAAAIGGATVGAKLPFQIDRQGTVSNVEVTLGVRPMPSAQPGVLPSPTGSTSLPAGAASPPTGSAASLAGSPSDGAAISALEQRVVDLERRMAELEAKVNKTSP